MQTQSPLLNSPPARLSYGKWLRKGLLLTLISLTISVLIIVLLYRWVNPPSTWLMVNRYFIGQKTQLVNPKQKWVPISEISPNIVQAVVAAEDNLFLDHFGFDFQSIKKAREFNKQGKSVRGASTITMQVAKNVFLWHGRTFTRKMLEAGFTFMIEIFWTKKRIMEVYLNVIELGPAIYGVEEASKLFFNKSAQNLTISESALLATVLPNPLFRNPKKPSRYMYSYQSTILKNMKNVGKIDFNSSYNEDEKTNRKKAK